MRNEFNKEKQRGAAEVDGRDEEIGRLSRELNRIKN
jgi:hypothetical protein